MRRWSHAFSFTTGPVSVLALILTVGTLSASLAQTDVPLALSGLTLKGVVANLAQHDGRAAVRLLEADRSRNTLGLAVVNGVTLTDGSIEVEVAGRRGPYSVPDDRGFIGLAFRITPSADAFEYVYLRPDNGRATDQVRRNHSTQYSSHPDFPWPRMRKEWPEKYESYVDLDYGAWTHMRIDIAGPTVRLFVNRATQPALVVNDLKLPVRAGGIALWIGAGTEGYFTNLKVRR
jgi:hypothetical protein